MHSPASRRHPQVWCVSRGEQEQRDGTPMFVMRVYLPVAESLGFNEEMSRISEDHVFAQVSPPSLLPPFASTWCPPPHLILPPALTETPNHVCPSIFLVPARRNPARLDHTDLGCGPGVKAGGISLFSAPLLLGAGASSAPIRISPGLPSLSSAPLRLNLRPPTPHLVCPPPSSCSFHSDACVQRLLQGSWLET